MANRAMLLGLVVLIGFLSNPIESKTPDKQEELERSKRRIQTHYFTPTIPNSLPFYDGEDVFIDNCPRDQVYFYGKCYQLLTQGPCPFRKYVLIDYDTKKPYCAQRLCNYDRIFNFGDQRCHDPRNSELCSGGRQLYETMYGTPICQCPDGSYEKDYECVPLLSLTNACPCGQVLWFSDFSRPAECMYDPCHGENLNRGLNDLPFIPMYDGRCFQMGSNPNICPAQTFYSLTLDTLQGSCSSLQDAGYQVSDQVMSERIIDIYGPFIPRGNISGLQEPTYTQISAGGKESFSNGILNNLIIREGVLLDHITTSSAGQSGDLSLLQAAQGDKLDEFSNSIHSLINYGPHNRNRRQSSFTGEVIDPKLAQCRAGVKRDVNNKCRTTVRLARSPPSEKSVAPKDKPCSPGRTYNIRRVCVNGPPTLPSINLG